MWAQRKLHLNSMGDAGIGQHSDFDSNDDANDYMLIHMMAKLH